MENQEQNRITLAIAFITLYVAIIIGFKDYFLKENFSASNDIIGALFQSFGFVVIIGFVFYLFFSALELDYREERHAHEHIFSALISRESAKKYKKWCFYLAVKSIFLSITFAVFSFISYIHITFGSLYSSLTFLFIFLLLYIPTHKSLWTKKKRQNIEK